MHGLHPETGISGVLFALVLELLFLGICTVFIGLGLTEINKRKNLVQNFLMVVVGFTLAAISLYATKLFIQG